MISKTKMQSRKKGYMYTLEVLIAASLIMVTFVIVFQSPPSKPALETSLIKQQGYNALEFLDNNGLLRPYVYSNDEGALETQIDAVLINSIKFETDICFSSCNMSNVPDDETVIVVDYYVSGYKNTFLGKKVRMWMWSE